MKLCEYLLEKDIKPSDIITRKSLENAIRLVTILGGSTNAVLHFLAIARAAQIDFTLEDFQKISDNTPFLSRFKTKWKIFNGRCSCCWRNSCSFKISY